MPTESFDKEFILKGDKEIESFLKIISSPVKSVPIDRNITSAEKEAQGMEKIKAMYLKEQR